MKKHLVKRKGHNEEYDERKVYASCYAAALNAHYNEKEAEEFAKVVTTKVNKWIKTKAQISSDDIRHQIIIAMHDPEVALLYKHHLDLS